jgi:branched-chain amino acid transport system substrate-binding protein
MQEFINRDVVKGSTLIGRRSLTALAAVCLGGLLAACSSGSSSSSAQGAASGSASSPASSSATSFKVAVVADLTGAGAPIGTAGADGFQAYVKSVNAAGGVGGHQIAIQVFDSQSSANASAAAFRAALATSPNLIFQSGLSSTLQSNQPLLTSAGVPVMSTTNSGPTIFTQPWFFTVSITDAESAQILAEYTKQLAGGSLQGKRIAWEGFDTSTVIAINKNAATIMEGEGAKIVDTELAEAGITSFATQAQKMVAAKPDVVFTLDQPDEVIVAKALATAGYTGPILASQGGAALQQFQAINNPKYYAYLDAVTPSAGDKLYTAAQKTGTSAGLINQYFTYGYGLGTVFVAAAKACTGSCGNQALISAIRGVGPLTPPDYNGPLTFSAGASGTTSMQLYYLGAGSKLVPSGSPVKTTASSS